MSNENGEARGGSQPSPWSAGHSEVSPPRLLLWASAPLCLAMPYLWMRPRLTTTGAPPLSIVSTTLILLGVCILSYGALRLSFVRVVSGLPYDTKVRQVLVWVVVGWIVLTTFLNIRCHDLMTESTEDTAIFEQSFWRTRSGVGFFDNTVEGQSHFGVHASFLLLLLYPLYHLYPSYGTLLACSNVCLGMSAIILFHLARRWMGERESLLVALIYLAHPVVLSQAAVNNFHELTLAVPCLLGLLYYLEVERSVPALVCAGLALLSKEDVALTVAALCLVQLLRRRLIWVSVLLGGGAVLWFALCIRVIIPHFNPHGLYRFIGGLSAYGDDWSSILTGIVTHPGQVLTSLVKTPRHLGFWYAMVQTSGLHLLLHSIMVVGAVPSLMENALYQNAGAPPSINSHYALLPALLLLTAAIQGAARGLSQEHSSGKLCRVLLSLLFINVGSFYYWLRPARYLPTPHAAARTRALAHVPREGAVLVPFYLLAKVARREACIASYGGFSPDRLTSYHCVVLDTNTPPQMAETAKPYYENYQALRRLLNRTRYFRLTFRDNGIEVYVSKSE